MDQTRSWLLEWYQKQSSVDLLETSSNNYTIPLNITKAQFQIIKAQSHIDKNWI